MGLRRRLASQSAILFFTRIAGSGLIFLAQAAMARLWGSEILGEYLVLMAAVNLIAVAMPSGFQTIAPYFAAEYRARGDAVQLRRFLKRSYSHVAISVVLMVAAYPLIRGLPVGMAQSLSNHWIQVCVLSLSTGLVFVNGAVLVGLKRPFAGFFADALFRPMVVMLSLGVALLIGAGAPALANMLWVLAGLYLIIALVHFAFVVRTARTVADEQAPVPGEGRRWWRFALPWVVITLATDFFFDLDLLLLAGLLGREDLAVFGVCTRIFALMAFGVSAVYAVTLPDMFEAEALKDRAGFLAKIGDANLVAAGLAVVLLLILAVLGPIALMLFGPGFRAGAMPLLVLCLSLVVRSVIGPASLVLSVHDRPYASLPAIALGLVVLVVANAILVPALGLMGAALAALLAITIWSVALWATALRIVGIDVSILPRLLVVVRRLRPISFNGQ